MYHQDNAENLKVSLFRQIAFAKIELHKTIHLQKNNYGHQLKAPIASNLAS